MNKQELINALEELKFSHVPVVQELSNRSQCYNEAIKAAILLAKKLDEPKKVIVPKFVAEWIETCKENASLVGCLQCQYFSASDDGDVYATEKVENWVFENDNDKLLANAWVNGYEIEEESLYHIVFTGLGNKGEDCYLWVDKSHNNEVYFSNKPNMGKNKFTEQEIKEIDERYWAFAVPVYK